MEPNNKGSEFSNITQTWDENERRRADAPNAQDADAPATPGEDLQQVIKQEAAEYDADNKEDRVLGGDRASVNDEASGTASDE